MKLPIYIAAWFASPKQHLYSWSRVRDDDIRFIAKALDGFGGDE